MDKFKEVKEFDIIICNEKYKNDNRYKYLDKNIFEELKNFIYEFNESNQDNDVLSFMQIGYKRYIGDVICIKNYVGLIELKSGFKLQILPKISLGSGTEYEKNLQTKRIFVEMIKSMKDFPGKVFTFANLNIDKMNIYEIFINMYIQEVRTLVKKGIKYSYVEKTENIPYFKGKLIVKEHIKVNKCHKEKFFMEFDEYEINIPENKIIKSTLLELLKISKSMENIKEIKQLLVFFELVEQSTNYRKDFSKVIIDRNTKNYELIIKWSEVFLLNKSFTTFSGTNYSKTLLFPMEKVFESYVSQNVKKVFKDFKVSIQDKGYYLFDSPKKFSLRPDLVVRGKDGNVIIMDIKWKILNNEKVNYGISQSDMYQMYSYAKKYKASEIYLLYPINDNMRECDEIEFISNDDKEKICVNVFFIELSKIQYSIEKLLDKVNNKGIIKSLLI